MTTSTDTQCTQDSLVDPFSLSRRATWGIDAPPV